MISKERDNIHVALRGAGWRGGQIPRHRGLRIMPHERTRLIAALALGPLGTALVLFLIPIVILPAWSAVDLLWCHALPGLSIVNMAYRIPFDKTWVIPVLNLSAAAPSPSTMGDAIGIVLLLLGIALFSRSNHLPTAFFCYSLAAVMTIGLLAFTPLLAPFPYGLMGYTQSMLLAGLVLMAVVPLLFMLIYFPLDFPLLNKAFLLSCVLLWLMLVLPAQFALQGLLIKELSLAAMPPLFLFLGLLLDVMGVVAIYSWGMSWRLVHES